MVGFTILSDESEKHVGQFDFYAFDTEKSGSCLICAHNNCKSSRVILISYNPVRVDVC